MRGLLLRLSALCALLIGGGHLVGCGGGGAGDLGGPSQQTFESLQITPTTATMAVGGNYPVSAIPVDVQGSHLAGMPAATFTSSDPSKATVTPAGMVTAVGEGTATITASVTYDGVTHTADCVVTITAAPVGGANDVNMVGTSFSPPTISIAVNDSVNWHFAGAVHNVTFSAAAPAGGNIPNQTPGTAVSRTFDTPGTYAYECTNHSNMTGTVVVQGAGVPVFTAVTVTPNSPSLAVNGTVQLVAAGLDQFGTAMSGASAASFTSSNSGIATASGTGLVTGVAAGSATITAAVTAGGVTKSATATVTVTSAQSGGTTVTTPNLTFSPASVTIAAGGAVTWQFSELTHNVTFTGAAPASGNIPDTSPGNAVSRTFATPGTYNYQCTRHSGMTGAVVVQGGAAPVFTSVTVTPTLPSIAVNGTVQLTAAALDQFGTALSGAPAPSFSSSNSATATVSGAGLVTGKVAGSATITASVTAGGVTKSATATVTVTSPQSGGTTVTTPNLTFSPASVTVAAGGTVTWQFSGALHNVSFGANKPTGGNIPDQTVGNAVSRTFATPGTYTYECTNHSNMTGTVVVQGGAAPVFTSVTVTPASPAIAVNGTVQLTAVALDQFGTALSGAPAASFSSSNSGIATASGAGLVTGVAAGSATITASVTAGGVTKTATSTVTVSSPQANDVSIATPNRTFSPRSVTAPVGTRVTWQFSDGTHNVTFSGGAPTGGNIPDQSSGNAVSRTFTTAGTYSYNCTNHSGMNGTITVQDGAAPPPGSPPPPPPSSPPTDDIVVSTTTDATFAPEEIEIARGSTVAWTFVGGTYNVTFKDESPSGGSIPTQAPGATVRRTFTNSGDYDYYCSLHKDMKGRIRVR